MSGGSHDYICYKIEEELVGHMEDRELDDLMRDIVTLTHDLEWYHSSDIGDDDYFKTVREFKQKWFGKDRNERLKDYIDESINEMKENLYNMIGVKEYENL